MRRPRRERLPPKRGTTSNGSESFSFHFPDQSDNSGFVGWLATHLKSRLGTGVFVVCGSNHSRDGIYDYWGCPISLIEDVIQVVEELRAH